MEFLDEDARPRFLLQSRAQPAPISNPHTQSFNKPLLFISIPISILLFALSFFFTNSEPTTSLLIWVAFSLLLGPFAPASLTGGDVRVGQGPVVDFPIQDQEKPQIKKTKTISSNGRTNANTSKVQYGNVVSVGGEIKDSAKMAEKGNGVLEKSGNVVEVEEEEEREWSEEDLELLKKQMAKNPVGKPRRWEVIAEAFKGRHKVESVVKTAKSLSQRKMGDDDSFARFLKDRKPSDRRKGGEIGEELDGNVEIRSEKEEVKWSAGEDIALLNALKVFPKDVQMRWEKISAAVPGKSKSACMKRIAELKKGFRSSKAASEA